MIPTNEGLKFKLACIKSKSQFEKTDGITWLAAFDGN